MKEDWQVNDLIVKVKDMDIENSYLDEESWLIKLAQMEDNIERTGVISFDEVNSPEKFLQNASLELLKELRQGIIKLVNVFNNNKSATSSAIKVYRINNTDADFMVFRNSLKLIFSIQRPGIIQISYNVSSAGIYSNLATNERIGDLIQAQMGPFNEAIWTFQGLKINKYQLLKYYLTKFIQNSVR